MSISIIFGATIRETREAKGLSQEGLAERAEMDRTYVSGVERGVRNPTLQVINRLAKALDVPMAKLFADVDSAERRSGK